MNNVTLEEIKGWFPGCHVVGDVPQFFSDVSGTVAEGHGRGWAFMPMSHIFEHDDLADVQQALQNGASAIIVDEALYSSVVGAPAIVTKTSAWEAFTALATKRRSEFSGKVVGVTGSAGKTTTRSFTAAFCRGNGPTVETFDNSGHDAGVRLCETRAFGDCRYLVVEMGIYAPHQMKLHTRQLKPNFAILTSIGSAHVGNFKSPQQLAKEKAKVFDKLYGDAPRGIVSRDMSQIDLVREMANCPLVEVSMLDKTAPYFGYTNNSNSGVLKISELNTGVTCVLRYGRPGLHICYDVLLAYATAREMGISADQCIEGLRTLCIPGNRWKKIVRKGITFIDDSFNANLDSMKGVLDIVDALPGRTIVVYGDVLEQGRLSEEIHRSLGTYAAHVRCDEFITYGPMSSTWMADSFDAETRKCGSSRAARRVETIASLKAMLDRIVQVGDTVILKASNAMHLSKVLE